MEGIYGFVNNLAGETISHHPERFVPYLTALGLFILSCNLIGLVPGLESPTAVPVVPLGCALFTWFYYHYHGVQRERPHRIFEALYRAARGHAADCSVVLAGPVVPD